ncbi:MAG TPA: SMP-30/gluconolactonase/LRE family protein [Pyrinomonadaceae bacterium]
MLKKIFLVVLVIILAGLGYLLLAPVPIIPGTWIPPIAPTLTGQYQQNNRLAQVQRLSLGDGRSPEDVALDSQGRIYAGLDDGRIIQLQPDGSQPQVFANTNGRPLGLVFDPTGNLIVADSIQGLLSIAPDGRLQVLATEADGAKFGCLNDLDVAADGTIYFTEASNKFPMSKFASDIIEHQPNGRFLSYDPKTRTTHTIFKGIYFANGVAVSPDQTFVLVAETGLYRVLKFPLSGIQQGQHEVFIDNLPGFPDGISSNHKDKFWLSLVTPRDQVLDQILPYPFMRKMVFRLPNFLHPAPKRYSFVLGLDANAKVVDNLQNGSPDCYAEIANTVEHDGVLYFGSIGENTVGKFSLH